MSFWHWLFRTDWGLAARVAGGACIFAALAAWDIRRKGREARRWREYVFLLAAVAAAMAYGALNDQITVTISWEYFYFGKELLHRLPADAAGGRSALLRWEAAKIGLKATWTAGLIIGVAILLANNPRKDRPQLPYRTLYRLMFVPLGSAAVMGALLGLAGYAGAFARWFGEIVEPDLWRPARFMAVWSVHLGGYVGGALGTAATVWYVMRSRRCLT